MHILIMQLYGRFDDHMKEIIKGAYTAFVLKAVGAVLSFVFGLLLARMLGAEGTGQYFLAFTVATIAAMLGRLGMDQVVVRMIASSDTENNSSYILGIYQKSRLLALIALSILTGVMFIAAPWVAVVWFGEPKMTTVIRWMALAVMPLGLFTLYACYLQGFKKIRDSVLILSVLVPLISLILTLVLIPLFNVVGVVIAYVIAAYVALMVGYLRLHKVLNNFGMVSIKVSSIMFLKRGWNLLAVGLMQLLINRASIIMLGIFSSSASVGIFGIANRTAALLSFVLLAVNSISAPKFASLYHQGNFKDLEQTAKKSARLMAVLIAPVVIAFLLAPGTIMSFFGADFADGGLVLAIISVGQFFNVITGSVGYLLTMSGHEKELRNTLIVSFVLCMMLNIILVPLYGLLGAALATALSMTVQNLLAMYVVRKKLGFWTLSLT